MNGSLYNAEFTPPTRSSEPEDASLKAKTGSGTAPCETSVWKTESAPYLETDWKAIPISPSAPKFSDDNSYEYNEATPNVCAVAYEALHGVQ